MQKKLIAAAKIAVTLGLVWVIYRYFVHIDNPTAVWNSLSHFSPLWLILGILSSFVNWGIEAKKWQILILQLEHLPFKTAFKSTLTGTAVSNIFPFKVGEYLGRIMYLSPENRIPAAVNSIAGSTIQLMVSIAFGIPAIFSIADQEKYRWVGAAAIAALVITPLAMFVVFYALQRRTFKHTWLQKIQEDIRKFTRTQFLHAILLSAARYLVFASFYVYLLYQCGISQNIPYLYAGVATVYLLQSFAPGMLITDAGLRTGLPLLVFQVPTHLQATLLAAAIFNYVINLLLPSVVGLFFIIVQKIKR
jgi:hypothetical protein